MPDNYLHNLLRDRISGAIERGETEPIVAVENCAVCGGELERSDQYPDAGYLHRNDSDDTHTPVEVR